MTNRVYTRPLESNTTLLSRLWSRMSPPGKASNVSSPGSPRAESPKANVNATSQSSLQGPVADAMGPPKRPASPTGQALVQAPLLQACQVATQTFRSRNGQAYMAAKMRENDAYLASLSRHPSSGSALELAKLAESAGGED